MNNHLQRRNGLCSYQLFEQRLFFIYFLFLLRIFCFHFPFLLQHPLQELALLIHRDWFHWIADDRR
ncbi:hypothetical protein Hanom_Chr09g00868991 [Helianthus anomalus]